MDWQPIETAPRDQRIMLCDAPDEEGFWWPVMGEYAWDHEGEAWYQPDGGPSGQWDFWAPLPAPPSQTGEE